VIDGHENDAVPYPITDELDLHTFRPAEVPELLEDYFAECLKRGLREVRVVHGKGTGALREKVHACLRRSPRVASFRTADDTAGGWGATRVTLQNPTAFPSPQL
jgi:DNA-nicking Smr family endonuclease